MAACTSSSRKYPKYKLLARDLPSNSKETLTRHRYQAQPVPGVPCKLAVSGASGRTYCFADTQHSSTRKNCPLLADSSSSKPPNFPPGFYLYGSADFPVGARTFACRYLRSTDFRMEDRSSDNMPNDFSVAVLGPYPDPKTRKLTVRCIDMEGLVDAVDATTVHDPSIANMGKAFLQLTTSGLPENVIPVPTADMLTRFYKDVENCDRFRGDRFRRFRSRLLRTVQQLRFNELKKEHLVEACDANTEFDKKVKKVLKHMYDMALYMRRWAGPGTKMPTDKLGPRVSLSRISSALRDKSVKATASGVKLTNEPGGNRACEINDHGLLQQMAVAHQKAAYLILTSCTAHQVRLLRDALPLGYNYVNIDGSGYWGSKEEVNNVYPPPNRFPNGNGFGASLDVLQMLYGTPTGDELGLQIQSSVFGQGGYCMQIASNMTGRAILTLLPYMYKRRPNWAALDGVWADLHS